jgi:hypothetical protein
MLIDWHTNLSSPEHFAAGENEFVSRVGVEVDGGPESHQRHVAGVADKFVVITMNFKRLKISVPNEYVADYVSRHGDRARGFACVDPMDEDAPDQLRYAIREFGNPILLDRIGREFPRLRMIVAHIGQPWTGELVVLLRKHPQIFSDLSARYHRKWQLYNGLMLAMDYQVIPQLLFGSDFPVRGTADALAEFRNINDWGEDVTLPRIPADVIEDIVNNRPFELIWPDG